MEFFRLRQPGPAAAAGPLADIELRGAALLGVAESGCLAFCDRLPSGREAAPACRQVILVPPALEASVQALFPAARLIAAEDPRALFIDTVAAWLDADALEPSSLIPGPLRVSPAARIGAGALIEPQVRIDAGARIGSGAVIRSGCWIGADAVIGENSVVGSVGINAYVGRDGRRRGFPHVAGVVVGAGASVGANAVVVRGIMTSTRIGAGCIVGNLCNVGHGVEIDADAWISAGTIIGGHTRIGAKATIGLGCAIRDNIAIGAAASVGMGSVVTKDVPDGRSVFGNPARTMAPLTTGPAR